MKTLNLRMKKCRTCGDKFRPWNSLATVCSPKCALAYAKDQIPKDAAIHIKKAGKDARAKHRADKDRIKARTGKNGHYDALKKALHKYVKHALREGEPCYTCGKPQSYGDSGGAFHVGHFVPAKEVDPRRFLLENLRIQCYSCNAMRSGMRVEYRAAMTNEMGLDHVKWLEAEVNHPNLKEKYPDIEDIKKEAAMYRELYRKAKM